MTIDTASEGLLQTAFGYAILFVEACGGLIIIAGVARAAVRYVRGYVLRYRPSEITELRIVLGRSMVVALEFQVAADILKTGLQPTWSDILLLAAIIALRTVLNLLLEHELQMLGGFQTPFVVPRIRDN